MGKVSVKLANPAGRFKDDSGKQLQAHMTYSLEASERVVKAIEIGLLEKIPNAQAEKEKENEPDPPKPDLTEVHKTGPSENKPGSGTEKK
jgi:hypothetical protein